LIYNVVELFTATFNTTFDEFYGFTGSRFDSICVKNLNSDFLLIDNVQIGSAVPEPASWALMIVGFGLTGAALRRRHAAAVNA
jgi:hypothetical protein